MKELVPYIIDKIEKFNVRHEIQYFNSGAIMIDIWVNNSFYVIQIFENTIGLSLITENTTPFDIIPDRLFKTEKEFKIEFENIFIKDGVDKKIISINGDNFNTLEGFYLEVDKVLTKNLSWETGHNLDAFNDLLRGGFGITDFLEPIKIIWVNSGKSKTELITTENKTMYQILINVIKEHSHIEFIEK